MVVNDIALQVIDVTIDPDLLDQDIAFTEDFSYAAAIPYNPVTPTVIDILPQLSSLDANQICPLVRESVSAAFPVSLSNDCGCSHFGDCNSEGSCECQDGYTGFACSYSNADYLTLTSQITQQVNILDVSVGSITDFSRIWPSSL